MKIVRYFECKVDGHNKFWEITIENGTYSTRWGQIDTTGTTKKQDRKYTNYEIQKVINGKLAKGYKEVGVKTRSLVVETKGPPPKKIPGGLELF